MDFVFSATAAEELQGKTFVVTGKLNTMTREEFKACLDACGAILSETLNSDTDYLITNTPSSGSAKNRKAEALGVKEALNLDGGNTCALVFDGVLINRVSNQKSARSISSMIGIQ